MRPPGNDDPRAIGSHRIIAVLGEGGMGRVYLAIGPDGERLALKRILSQYTGDPEFRARFAKEVQAARRVSGPNVVQIVDADTTSAEQWSTTEFVAGPTLDEAVAASGPFSAEHVRRLGGDLAAALNTIHGAGLIHRDVKPSNVLLSARGAMLLDFGISRALDYSSRSALTQTGRLIGTPGYMSPEQAQSQPLTEKSDVFSLGCVLVTAATGRAPFDGPSIPQILYKLVHGEPDLDGVPSTLREAIDRCLSKDPESRPSPLEVRRLLERSGTVTADLTTIVQTRIIEQEAAIASLLPEAPLKPTLVDTGPTMMYTRPATPPTPDRRPPRHWARTAVLVATVLSVMIGALAIVNRLQFSETPSGFDDSATVEAVTTAESPEASDTPVIPPSTSDIEASLSVPSIGATAIGLSDAWGPLYEHVDWEPYRSTDIQTLPTSEDAYGFIGIGLLDQSALPYSSENLNLLIKLTAQAWADDSWGSDVSLSSSDIAVTSIEIDGRPAVLGEFRLEWEDPVADGDIGGENAIILADLEDDEVFVGFLGLFDSQTDQYDAALDVLLSVTLDG